MPYGRPIVCAVRNHWAVQNLSVRGALWKKRTIAAVFTQRSRPGMSYIYGTGKLTAHCISKSLAAQLDIAHCWGVITNAYGPMELSPRFINSTIRKILSGDSLQFTAATQNYDFIYITDVAQAFYRIGLHGKAFNEYVIGSSAAKPLREFIGRNKADIGS